MKKRKHNAAPSEGRAAVEPVLISMLEHYSYCPRQCALIHLDAGYEENIYTLRGTLAHQSVDEAGSETSESVRIERAMPLWSEKLGLRGKADVVEFRGQIPYPIEYKLGKKRPDRHADVQLCAQALCLEEMLGSTIPAGAVYHIRSKRRREVEFTPQLRGRVTRLVDEIRNMLNQTSLPQPAADKRCQRCSLNPSCLPYVLDAQDRLAGLAAALFTADREKED